MKFINHFLDLLLYSSLFAACCATGLCMATERLISGSAPLLFNNLHLLVFGSSLTVYNVPKLIAAHRQKKMKISKWWFILFFSVGFAMMAMALPWLDSDVIKLSVILGALAFAYYLPVLPFKTRKRIREFGWLKILVLTGVWTVATSILPIVYMHKQVRDFPLEVLLRFAFIFALCVAFDIRDMTADMRDNINTLPHKMGVQNSYRLITTSLLVFIILSIFQFSRYHQSGRLAGAMLTAIITWGFVAYLQKHPSHRGYLLLVDGAMILYSGLVLLH